MSGKRRNPSFWELNNSWKTKKESSTSLNADSDNKKARPEFPSLINDIHCDICIVGGGITGLSLAYKLVKEDPAKDIVVLEAESIASGVSGANSAHLDPLTDADLKDLIDSYGEESAKAIINGNKNAINFIETVSKEENIPCAFKRITGSFVTEDKDGLKYLEEEFIAAKKIGLEAKMLPATEKPYPNIGGLEFDAHARFNPLSFVLGLAAVARKKGVRVYENSFVNDFDDDQVILERGKVNAKKIVLATHYPIGLFPTIQTRVFPYRSYMIGVEVLDKVDDKLFWDTEDPYHYIRIAGEGDKNILLIGGADHKSAEAADTSERIERLVKFAQERFTVVDVPYKWSSQFYPSADGLPYIGKAPIFKNIYISTGYDGNGLTYGVYAAELLKDELLGKKNKDSKLFTPSRVNFKASFKHILSENSSVAKDFFKDRLAPAGQDNPRALAPDEGGIFNIEGEKLACYKNEKGDIEALSPVCTHAGCHVRWNSFEKTWDCPCHGGRYSATGEVIQGPPTHALKKADKALLKEDDNLGEKAE